MHVYRKLIFTLLLSGSCLCLAATEFETTVPVNLVRYITGGVAYHGLPDNFPPFVMPEGLQPIGSQDSSLQQMVLLRTSRGGAASQTAVMQSLMAEGGWMTLAPIGPQRQNGFVVPAAAPQPVSLCHDVYGELEIRGEGESDVENRVYIRRLNRLAMQQNWPGCAAFNEARQGRGRLSQMDPPISIEQHMPSFAFLIEAAAADRRAFNSGSGAPTNSFSPLQAPSSALMQGRQFGVVGEVFLESTLSLSANSLTVEDVNDLVIEQMGAEGWELDARWDGNTGAGCNWVRTPEPGLKLFLSFVVLKTATPDYEANIKLIALELPDE